MSDLRRCHLTVRLVASLEMMCPRLEKRRAAPWYTTISSSFKQGCNRIKNEPWVLESLAATLAISAVGALSAEGCEGLEGEPATAPSGGSGRGVKRGRGAMENLEELESREGALKVVLENEGRGNLMFRVP
jgi:hypothetical protein